MEIQAFSRFASLSTKAMDMRCVISSTSCLCSIKTSTDSLSPLECRHRNMFLDWAKASHASKRDEEAFDWLTTKRLTDHCLPPAAASSMSRCEACLSLCAPSLLAPGRSPCFFLLNKHHAMSSLLQTIKVRIHMEPDNARRAQEKSCSVMIPTSGRCLGRL